MADAAAKVGDGKSSWQRFVGGVVDMVRPVAAGLAPAVMPLLDRPAMRRVEQAVNIEDLRVAAEKRAPSVRGPVRADVRDCELLAHRDLADRVQAHQAAVLGGAYVHDTRRAA